MHSWLAKYVNTVLFGYIPAFYSLLYDCFHENGHLLDELTGKGDLVLISCAIMADGIGRVILRIKCDQAPLTGGVIASLLFCLVFIGACLMVFAAGRGGNVVQSHVKIGSYVIAVATALLSAIIILFVEES